MKNLYLIAYDISSNKMRNKIAELLEQYGERINLSVFECMLSHRQKEEIIDTLGSMINPQTDSIRVYFICKTCYGKSTVIGREEPPGEYYTFIKNT